MLEGALNNSPLSCSVRRRQPDGCWTMQPTAVPTALGNKVPAMFLPFWRGAAVRAGDTFPGSLFAGSLAKIEMTDGDG